MRATAATFGLLSLTTLAMHASAQSIVVPLVNDTVRGATGNSAITNPVVGATYMACLPANELARLPVGAQIYGLSFRAGVQTSNPASWPAGDASWTSYDVTIGYSVPVGSFSGTFASNWITTPLPPVQVRSGPMIVESGTFPNNSSLPGTQPNPFGDFFWDFQKPFTYLGGDLAVLIEYAGAPAQVALFLDRAASTPTTVMAFYAGSYQAASGTQNNFPIARVHYGYGSGCPGTAGATPVLVLTNDTTGGGPTTFSLANAPANATAAYVLGVTKATVPLPNGCSLLTPPLVVVPATLTAKGRHLLALTVPASAFGTVEAQGFVLDAGAPGGFTSTNGVTLTAR